MNFWKFSRTFLRWPNFLRGRILMIKRVPSNSMGRVKLQNMCSLWTFKIEDINPQAPDAQFFFNRTLLTPHQIFDAHLLVNTDLGPSRFRFSVGFISRSWIESDGFIAYSNEWDWREKERCLFTLTNLYSNYFNI